MILLARAHRTTPHRTTPPRRRFRLYTKKIGRMWLHIFIEFYWCIGYKILCECGRWPTHTPTKHAKPGEHFTLLTHPKSCFLFHSANLPMLSRSNLQPSQISAFHISYAELAVEASWESSARAALRPQFHSGPESHRTSVGGTCQPCENSVKE